MIWSHHRFMRGIVWIVVLIALTASLDSFLNNGFYTQAFARMFSDIRMHFVSNR